MPVSTLVTATFAPGTDVPAGSDTRPVICPVCANAKPVNPTISSMRCTTRLLSEHQYDRFCQSCQEIITPFSEPERLRLHVTWPAWRFERGKAIRYGPASCPRSLDILSRSGRPAMHPKYTDSDVNGAVLRRGRALI